MGKTLRARVRHGTLELLEKLDLPDDTEVTIMLLDIPSRQGQEAFCRAAGAWKGHSDAATLLQNIYADRLVSTRPEPRL